jgi:hypothetical protein
MKKILIVCGDITNIGGAATNSYNLLKLISDTEGYNGIGLFISTLSPNNYDLDPDNLSNIYHLNLDDKIEDRINEFKKNIGNIDIIFCKNYKIFPLVYNCFNCPIIYSPSGIRYVGLNISNKYINDLIMNNFWDRINKYTIKNSENLYKFIKQNDKYLEKYVFEKANNIVCNSHLTNKLVESYFKSNNLNTDKLINPLYLSNISLYDNQHNYKFNDREYDIGFISYSWRRHYKNYSLVLDLLLSKELSDYSIVIIGGNQLIDKYHSNITFYEFLNKEEINNIYIKIKSVVIPSTYDSNPNVLVESINYGCNVVTSPNVGNSNYINNDLIVNDYKNIKSWIEKIKISLLKEYNYIGPKRIDISNQFFNMIDKVVENKSLL